MALLDYAAIITEINAEINTNGVEAITGAILNDVLKDMVDSTYNKITDAPSVGFSQHGTGASYSSGQAVQRNGRFSIARRNLGPGSYNLGTDWAGDTAGGIIGYQLYSYSAYNIGLTYTTGNYVRFEYGLYRAIANVSAGLDPTNAGLWTPVYVNNNKFGNVWAAGSFANTDVVLGPDNLLYKAVNGSVNWLSTSFSADVTAGNWVLISGGGGGGANIVQNVTDGDTVNAPSGDATYDAIAGSLAAAKAYADGLVIGLWDDRGSFTPSGNYPNSASGIGGSGPSGAIRKGDTWIVAGLGTNNTALVGTKTVSDGDVVRALVDAAGLTTDAQWGIQENNLGFAPLNASLASGKIYIGSAGGIGTAQTLTGPVTVDNTGLTAIANNAITDAMINSVSFSKVTGFATIVRYTAAWSTQTMPAARLLVYIVIASDSTIKTLNMFATPVAGDMVYVIDGKGDAGTYNITVQGNGKQINGDTACLVMGDRDSIGFVYDGTSWSIF